MEDVVVTQEWLEEQVRAATSKINKVKKFIIIEGVAVFVLISSAAYILFGSSVDEPLYARLVGSSIPFMLSCIFVFMAAKDSLYIGEQKLIIAIVKYHLARIAAHELFEPR